MNGGTDGTIDISGNLNVTGTGTHSSDVEITDTTKGVILKSPDGTRWRITIDNTGVLTTTSL